MGKRKGRQRDSAFGFLPADPAEIDPGFEPPTFTMLDGKYRLRTALRENLLEAVAERVPKGRHDCGNHEWYLAEAQTWRCYHCVVGVTNEVPWDEREFAARQLEGQAMNLRAGLTSQDRVHTQR
jgi:hypothetical protein